jgi:Trypsin
MKHMLKRFALLAALAAMLVTFAGSAGAITGNYTKDFKNDFVGLVVFYTTPDENGDIFSHRCSGSLLADRVTVVTAGHCTEGVDTGRVYFQQAAAPNYSPAAFGGLGGDEATGYPYTGGNKANQPYSRAFRVADNYGFHNFEGYPNNRDVGVVVLDKPYTTPSGTYGQLPKAGAVDAYIAANGNKKDIRFVSSGYGLSDHNPVIVSFRERLTASAYLVNWEAPVTEYNLKTTANPSQGKGGTCNGDSGGPIFFAGTRTIAAVTSFGMNAECKGLDFSYRLDRQEVLDWINDPDRVDAG